MPQSMLIRECKVPKQEVVMIEKHEKRKQLEQAGNPSKKSKLSAPPSAAQSTTAPLSNQAKKIEVRGMIFMLPLIQAEQKKKRENVNKRRLNVSRRRSVNGSRRGSNGSGRRLKLSRRRSVNGSRR